MLLKERTVQVQVVNYLWDGSVSPNAMFVHQLDQLALLEGSVTYSVPKYHEHRPEDNPGLLCIG